MPNFKYLVKKQVPLYSAILDISESESNLPWGLTVERVVVTARNNLNCEQLLTIYARCGPTTLYDNRTREGRG